jgi:flagellar hook-associated protein 3 FlgL
MRVSNDTLRSAFLAALNSAQTRLLATQQQISTGKRVNTPSDDPVAAARIAHLNASLSRLDQYKTNGVFARNQLGLEEETLNQAISNLQGVRDLVLQANNSTTSDADRRTIASSIAQQRDAMLALANTTDVDGRHLFSGYAEASAPFTVGSAGNVVYNGDQGQRTLQISDSRFVAVNDSGADVFQRIPAGNGTFVLAVSAANTGTGTLGTSSVTDPTAWVADTYTISFTSPTSYEVRDSANTLVQSGTSAPPTQSIAFRGISISIDGQPATGDTFTVSPSTNRDVFSTLDSIVATLNSSAGTPAQGAKLHSDLGQQLSNIDSALSHLIDVRGEIGARAAALDQQDSMNADFGVHLSTTLSSVQDLDYAAAVTKLSQEQLGLDAAQQAYAHVQSLSLFKYL